MNNAQIIEASELIAEINRLDQSRLEIEAAIFTHQLELAKLKGLGPSISIVDVSHKNEKSAWMNFAAIFPRIDSKDYRSIFEVYINDSFAAYAARIYNGMGSESFYCYYLGGDSKFRADDMNKACDKFERYEFRRSLPEYLEMIK